MISFEQALELTLNVDFNLITENVNILKSLNRVLAEDVISDIDMPPYNKSAMDGYAMQSEDINDFCEVIEIIPAGKNPEKKISKKTCSKIMTGAVLPDNANIVIPVEDVEIDDKGRIKCSKPQKSDNICRKGEDIHKGQTVINKGTIIKSQHIPVLASVGCVNPLVYKQKQITVAATGNELVEPDIMPGEAMIRNSNAYQLIAQIENTGSLYHYAGIIPDNEKSIINFLRNNIHKSDLIIITGGVSAGDFDYVPLALQQFGAIIIYKSIAIQPGRPVVFAKYNDKYIWGLPGNPVSSYVIFDILVKPLIFKITGADYQPLTLKFPLNIDYERNNAERLAVIPVKIYNGSCVIPIEYHGSAHINALTQSNAYAFIPSGIKKLKKGEMVNVRLL